MHRITRLVFLLEGVVVSPDPDQIIQPGMARVLDDLHHRLELWLVTNYAHEQLAAIISKNSLAKWFENDAVFLIPEHTVDNETILQSMVEAGVIIPGRSLWIDHHPIRTMLAIRHGIDSSIFVDGDRLYRDLWLWGIVSLDK